MVLTIISSSAIFMFVVKQRFWDYILSIAVIHVLISCIGNIIFHRVMFIVMNLQIWSGFELTKR